MASSSALAQEDIQPLDLRFTHRGDVVYFIADAEQAGEEAKAAKQSQGEYWLGVQIAELPEVAKQQLGVDQGLVVEDVMPDSPAAKAEIRKHDILVKADDNFAVSERLEFANNGHGGWVDRRYHPPTRAFILKTRAELS